MQPSFQYHLFFCLNKRSNQSAAGCCASKNAEELFIYMKNKVKTMGLKNIRINKSGCLSTCAQGIAVVIYPENTWYSLKSKQDIDTLIEVHFIKQQKAKSLLM